MMGCALEVGIRCRDASRSESRRRGGWGEQRARESVGAGRARARGRVAPLRVGGAGGARDEGEPRGLVVLRRNDLGYRTRFETVTSLEALKLGGNADAETASGASWVLDEVDEAPGAWDGGNALEAGRQSEIVRRQGVTPVRVRLNVDQAGADLYVSGTVDTTVRCDCRRCLCDVYADLALPFNVLLTHTPGDGGWAGSSGKKKGGPPAPSPESIAEPQASPEGKNIVTKGNGVTVRPRGGKKNRPDQAPREDELFFPSGENERDLSAVVRDTVLIAVPTDALCSENCRGITNPYGSVTFAGDPDHVDIGTMSFSDVPDGQGTMLLDDDTLNQLDGLFGGGGDD